MIIMAIVYLLLISSCLLQWSSGTAFNPVVYDTKAPLSSQCGQSDPFEDDQQLMEALKMAQQQLPPPGCNPPPTCIDILLCNSSASSGYYQIQAANGSLVQAYCDMEGTNCGGQAGWMRVAHLNITDPSSQCPAGFRVVTRNNKMFCIRDAAGCQPITVESFGLTYSRVCGYVRGYAYRTPDGFWRQHLPAGSDVSLSGNYVDGVSITYGTSPISHIWTYAAGRYEVDNSPYNANNCPCNTNGTTSNIPEFVSNDYYCESSAANLQADQLIWFTNDPLWDGMQCGGNEVPCCNHAGLPWFNKNTLTPTTATITMRVCMDEDTSNEDMGIEGFELYIQ